MSLLPKKAGLVKETKASKAAALVEDFNNDIDAEVVEGSSEERLVFDIGQGRNMAILGHNFKNGIIVTDHEETINDLISYGKQMRHTFVNVEVYDPSNPEHNRHAVRPSDNAHVIAGTHTVAHYKKSAILDDVFSADAPNQVAQRLEESNRQLSMSNLDPSLAVPNVNDNLMDMSSLMGGVSQQSTGNSIIDQLNALGADTSTGL